MGAAGTLRCRLAVFAAAFAVLVFAMLGLPARPAAAADAGGATGSTTETASLSGGGAISSIRVSQQVAGGGLREGMTFDYTLRPLDGAPLRLADRDAVHTMTPADAVSEGSEDTWLSTGGGGSGAGGAGDGSGLSATGGTGVPVVTADGALKIRAKVTAAQAAAGEALSVFPKLKFTEADLQLSVPELDQSTGSWYAVDGSATYPVDRRYLLPSTFSSNSTPYSLSNGVQVGRWVYAITQTAAGGGATVRPATEYAVIYLVKAASSSSIDVQVYYFHDYPCTWQWRSAASGESPYMLFSTLVLDRAGGQSVAAAPFVNTRYRDDLALKLTWEQNPSANVRAYLQRLTLDPSSNATAAQSSAVLTSSVVEVDGEKYQPSSPTWTWEFYDGTDTTFDLGEFSGDAAAPQTAAHRFGPLPTQECYLSAASGGVRTWQRRLFAYRAMVVSQAGQPFAVVGSDTDLVRRSDHSGGMQVVVRNTRDYSAEAQAVVKTALQVVDGAWDGSSSDCPHSFELSRQQAEPALAAGDRAPAGNLQVAASTSTQVGAGVWDIGLGALPIEHGMLALTGRETWERTFTYTLKQVVPNTALAYTYDAGTGTYTPVTVAAADGAGTSGGADAPAADPAAESEQLSYGNATIAQRTDPTYRWASNGWVLDGSTSYTVTITARQQGSDELKCTVAYSKGGVPVPVPLFVNRYVADIEASGQNTVVLYTTWVDDGSAKRPAPDAYASALQLKNGTGVVTAKPQVTGTAGNAGITSGSAQQQTYKVTWSGLSGAASGYIVQQAAASGYSLGTVERVASTANTAVHVVTNVLTELDNKPAASTGGASGGSSGSGSSGSSGGSYTPAPSAPSTPAAPAQAAKTVNATAVVSWIDSQAAAGARPNYVELAVVKSTDGSAWSDAGKTLRVTGADSEAKWTATIEGLPESADGAKLYYAFEDRKVPANYRVSGQESKTLVYTCTIEANPEEGAEVMRTTLGAQAQLIWAIRDMLPVSVDGYDISSSMRWTTEAAYAALGEAVEDALDATDVSGVTREAVAAEYGKLADAFSAYEESLSDGLVGEKFSITTSSGTFTYRIASKKTATLVKAVPKNGASVTVNTVKHRGATLKVTKLAASAFANTKVKEVAIGANVKAVGEGAFKGASKLKTLTVKSKKLTKSGVKGSLKGSSIKTVKVKASSSKATNKTYVKRYKSYFAKANSGKNVQIK